MQIDNLQKNYKPKSGLNTPKQAQKAQSLNNKQSESKNQLDQFFDFIQKQLSILKKAKSTWLNNVICGIETNVNHLRKYVNYMKQFNQKKDFNQKNLQKQYQSTKEALTKVVVENSKFKDQIILLYAMLQEKDNQIQKLKVMNKINVSYASSLSFREDYEKGFGDSSSQSSIEKKSSRSYESECSMLSQGPMDVYCSDSQQIPKRDVKSTRNCGEKSDQYAIKIQPPPVISDSKSILKHFDKCQHQNQHSSIQSIFQNNKITETTNLSVKKIAFKITNNFAEDIQQEGNQKQNQQSEQTFPNLVKRKTSDQVLISSSEKSSFVDSIY